MGPRWGRLGGSWGVSGLVFRGSEGPWGHFFEVLSSREAVEAKTAKCLNLMTLSSDLLCRRGLGGFKTRSKRSQEGRKSEKRDDGRGKREEKDKKERSGGSGVALGRPKGAPRGYEGHRRGGSGSKSPPRPASPEHQRCSEQSIKDAKKRRSEATRGLTRRRDGEFSSRK